MLGIGALKVLFMNIITNHKVPVHAGDQAKPTDQRLCIDFFLNIFFFSKLIYKGYIMESTISLPLY